MQVTIVLDETVWREFKAECTRRGFKASYQIEDFLRGQLKKWGVELKEEPKKGGERKR